jgi:hypothetical protein
VTTKAIAVIIGVFIKFQCRTIVGRAAKMPSEDSTFAMVCWGVVKQANM